MTSEVEEDPPEFDRLFAQRERIDATGDFKVDGPANLNEIDATCMHEENDSVKMQRDVAFAAAAIETKVLSERQLTSALKSWTIHGDELLSSHLYQQNLISTEIRNDLERKAVKNLQVAVARASRGDGSTSDSTATLLELDPSGRLVRLMGLNIVAKVDLADRSRRVTTEYQLLRRLGQGGMGTVWLARDEKLGRLVAIKEIRKRASENESAIFRFRREAQVTGRLEHPSIVPVHQLGEHQESGKAFYVMRFIGKRTLEDAISEYHERRDAGDVNPMHLHHLLTAFVTVCQAIAFANSRNVVHRDLKPENIALDDYGQVIVLDWGLAKLTGRGELQEIFGDLELSDMSDASASTAGQVLGTPMYMAPEQAAGRVDEIEQTTDVYGLGAILFSILTGYAPHEMSHQSLASNSRASELFQSIVSSDAPDALSIDPEAPPELAAVCTKAMANKRYARYANALDLGEDVQRWMAGEPVSTYVEPWRKRTRRWIAAHHRISQLASVLLTVFLVAAITLGITSQQSRLAQQQNRFESLKADGRELQVSLRSVSEQLSKDARFMATLPPIQGIASARANEETDPEDVWRERLETIYRGLLESNPNYLTISYSAATSGQESKDELDGVEELVHVERQVAADPVRVMPESRLVTRASSEFLSTILRLKPSEVAVHGTTVHHAENASAAQPLVLAAGTPIYSDVSGDVFGVVTVETDLEEAIRDLLVNTMEAGGSAYLVDPKGKVLLHYSRDHGFHSGTVGRDIGDLVKSAGQFFKSEQRESHYSEGREVYGLKVRIDPRHSDEYLGIVLTVKH